MADSSVNVTVVLLKILGFFVFSGIIGVIFTKYTNDGQNLPRRDCKDMRLLRLCSVC